MATVCFDRTYWSGGVNALLELPVPSTLTASPRLCAAISASTCACFVSPARMRQAVRSRLANERRVSCG